MIQFPRRDHRAQASRAPSSPVSSSKAIRPAPARPHRTRPPRRRPRIALPCSPRDRQGALALLLHTGRSPRAAPARGGPGGPPPQPQCQPCAGARRLLHQAGVGEPESASVCALPRRIRRTGGEPPPSVWRSVRSSRPPARLPAAGPRAGGRPGGGGGRPTASPDRAVPARKAGASAWPPAAGRRRDSDDSSRHGGRPPRAAAAARGGRRRFPGPPPTRRRAASRRGAAVADGPAACAGDESGARG